eukprot:2720530-Alexandrium_andersonii.AAC.1
MALKSHAARVHSFVAKAQFFAEDTGYCSICLSYLHTRPRLVFHLWHDSPSCLQCKEQVEAPLALEQ